MTWYRHKRWWLLVFCLLLTLIVSYIWQAKNRLVISLAAPYLAPYQLNITCLDWSLAWPDNNWQQPSLAVKQLCLTHSHGNIIITDLAIDNLQTPNLATINNISVSSDLTLGQIHQTYSKPSNNHFAFNQQQLFVDINDAIASINIPLNFSINQLLFSAPKLKHAIKGNINYNRNTLTAKLSYSQQLFSLTAELNTPSFELKTSNNLSTLIDTLSQQQLSIAKIVAGLDLQGTLATSIHYQGKTQKLLGVYHLADFNAQFDSLSIKTAAKSQGSVELSTDAINWQNNSHPMRFNITSTTQPLTFASLKLSQFSQALSQQPQIAQLNQLLKSNSINQLTLILAPQARFSLQNQQLNSSGPFSVNLSDIGIKTNDNVLAAQLNNINFDQKNNAYGFNLNATAQAIIPQLSAFTTQPITANITTAINGQANDIKLSDNSQISLQLSELKQANIKVDHVDIKLQGPIHYQKQQLELQSRANIQLGQIKLPQLNLIDTIDITSQHQLSYINSQHNQNQTTAQIQLNGATIGQIKLSGQLLKPNVTLSAEDLSLNTLLALVKDQRQLPELLSGKLDFNLQTTLNQLKQPLNNTIKGQFALKDLSGDYKDTWFEQLHYQQKFTLQQGQLTTEGQNNLSIAKIETGTDITNTQAQVNFNADLLASDIQPTFSVNMENVSTQAFGGKVHFQSFTWPNTDSKAIELQLEGIDLAKVVALEKNKDIVVTGLISGQLPTTFVQMEHTAQMEQRAQNDKKSSITINNGELHNITDGVILINNSAAIQRLKDSREDLKLAFDALHNLHYHHLTSQVTMSDDGRMYLETVIKGKNPDLDNEVNFNLNLDYDLLGLLQSARISQNIEQQINDKVQN